MAERIQGIPSTDDLICIEDFHVEAAKRLPKLAYDYYASGARDEYSLSRNRTAFQRISLLPRVLRDVRREQMNLSINVLNVSQPSPIMIAATAMHQMADPQGEVATAKAAAQSGTLMMLSSLSTVSLEEVAKAADGKAPLWFQLYVLKDRNATLDLVRRCERSNYLALVVTVDAPVLGTRERDVRNRFRLPAGMTLAHYAESKDNKLQSGSQRGGSGLEIFINDNLDAGITWKDIDWLRGQTKLPIILKGVHHPEDALLAIRHGLSGIIVSNHGARQVDTVPASIEMLPGIVQAVQERMPVYFDGGVRRYDNVNYYFKVNIKNAIQAPRRESVPGRGTDVFKALAFGAAGVFIGRPILWGLAVGGQEGVSKVIKILTEELFQTMQLCGTPTIRDIGMTYITPRSLL